MSRQEATEFFAHYRDIFNRLDGDAVADTWHVPSSIADAHGAGGTARVTTYADDASLRANMHALCDVYRRNGFARAEFELIDHIALGAQHAFAHVHWTLRRADGSELQSFRTGYQLACTTTGVRALMAVAYQEDLKTMAPHAAQ
jgi:membrane-bound lytic murein transglycosylase MltF